MWGVTDTGKECTQLLRRKIRTWKAGSLITLAELTGIKTFMKIGRTSHVERRTDMVMEPDERGQIPWII